MGSQGFKFLGSKARFDGFGVVMSPSAGHTRRPSISFIRNDGRRELNAIHDLPAPDAKIMSFRNTRDSAVLRIRVKHNTIEGDLQLGPNEAKQEIFRTHLKDPIGKGGFIGLTAASGSADGGAVPDRVTVSEVRVLNYDETSIGEAMYEADRSTQHKYEELIDESHHHFADQKAQTSHLKQLTDMIEDHLQHTSPIEE